MYINKSAAFLLKKHQRFTIVFYSLISLILYDALCCYSIFHDKLLNNASELR